MHDSSKIRLDQSNRFGDRKYGVALVGITIAVYSNSHKRKTGRTVRNVPIVCNRIGTCREIRSDRVPGRTAI